MHKVGPRERSDRMLMTRTRIPPESSKPDAYPNDYVNKKLAAPYPKFMSPLAGHLFS